MGYWKLLCMLFAMEHKCGKLAIENYYVCSSLWNINVRKWLEKLLCMLFYMENKCRKLGIKIIVYAILLFYTEYKCRKLDTENYCIRYSIRNINEEKRFWKWSRSYIWILYFISFNQHNKKTYFYTNSLCTKMYKQYIHKTRKMETISIVFTLNMRTDAWANSVDADQTTRGH